jgi:hypothetical protein
LGGGIFNNAGTLTLSNSTVSGNSAGHSGFGGGIFNTSFGRLTLTNSTVSDNSADRGGGVFIDSGGATLTNSTVSGNSARIVGGILNGDTFVGASGGLLTLTNSTVSVNVGGGVSNADRMTLTNSTVSNNVGVGVSNGSGPFGLMTLTTSTVSGNTGVGILNSAFAEVTKSTVSGNSASAQSGGIVSSGTLTMTNSTVSGNVGGGILSTGDLTVTNSTVSGNLAGAGIFANFSSLGMKNSIVANHTGGNCGGNANALFFSHGYNLSDDATCSFFFKQTTDLNSTPAGLDPGGLKPNGGPTETIALLPTSAAVDAIPVSSCTDVSGNAVTTDQRGVPRPQGPACDIGAFEFFASSFQIEAVETFLIIDSVQSLPLPPGTQQGLIAPLRAAVDSLNRGDAKPAVNQLGAFINQVDAQMHSGVLTPQQAAALTTQAQGVIQSLGGLS